MNIVIFQWLTVFLCYRFAAKSTALTDGGRGTLILTDNAPPLDMLKVSNPTPSFLPWFFSYLGPFKYTLFCAVLENDRDYPYTRYGGARIDFKPTPNLEIGMSHTFQFGGTGSPSSSSFLNYLELVSLSKTATNDLENHEVAIDFRYRMPFLQNVEVYAEYGGEDTGLKPNIREFLFQDIGTSSAFTSRRSPGTAGPTCESSTPMTSMNRGANCVVCGTRTACIHQG